MYYIKIDNINHNATDFHLLSCMITDGIFPSKIFIDSDEGMTNPYSTPIICFEYRSDLKVYQKSIQARIEFSTPGAYGRQFAQSVCDFYSPQQMLVQLQKNISTLRL